MKSAATQKLTLRKRALDCIIMSQPYVLNRLNKDGRCPLHYALRIPNIHSSHILMLLNYHKQYKHEFRDMGLSYGLHYPLHMSAEKTKLPYILGDDSMNSAAMAGVVILVVILIISKCSDIIYYSFSGSVEKEDSEGNSPLHIAALENLSPSIVSRYSFMTRLYCS
jgi:ankyrin repeat protein